MTSKWLHLVTDCDSLPQNIQGYHNTIDILSSIKVWNYLRSTWCESQSVSCPSFLCCELVASLVSESWNSCEPLPWYHIDKSCWQRYEKYEDMQHRHARRHKDVSTIKQSHANTCKVTHFFCLDRLPVAGLEHKLLACCCKGSSWQLAVNLTQSVWRLASIGY